MHGVLCRPATVDDRLRLLYDAEQEDADSIDETNHQKQLKSEQILEECTMIWKNEERQFTLYAGELPVLTASAACRLTDGKRLDSRNADTVDVTGDGQEMHICYGFEQAGVVLEEILKARDNAAEVQCVLRSCDGKKVSTNSLTPLVARGKGDDSPYVWRDLRSKMLLVPYDNDMWMRYETVALHAGLRSADVTTLFQEDLSQAILFGAMDFDVWKNAIACPGTDARILEARCGSGACGEDTHDREEHGAVSGEAVASSRFVVLYGEDWRDLLEKYADILHAERAPRTSAYTVPFGFNCYAGLGRSCSPETFRTSGEFVFHELMPKGFENAGTSFINLDGGWQFLVGREESLKIRDELHARGQKAGIYDAPFACFERDLTKKLPGLEDHAYEEILLRDHAGELLPRVDGSIPYDVTHPVWREWTEKKLQTFLDWGYDYLKIDFLSHGGMEGKHYDPSVTTGRQALHRAYTFVNDFLDEKRIGRPFFLSLSIAPLFPYGFGNSRRFSCDAFGLTEDVEYVLNAHDYSWWTGGRLYQYNDPDHIVLLRSFCMLRDSTEGEARARYTSAVICGPMLLLSDDYRREEARARTKAIASNEAVNAVARKGLAFRPIMTGVPVYMAKDGADTYLAVFSLSEDQDLYMEFYPDPEAEEDGTWTDLWTGKVYEENDGNLQFSFEGTDALLLVKRGTVQA